MTYLGYDFCLFRRRQAEEMLEQIALHLSSNRIDWKKIMRNNKSGVIIFLVFKTYLVNRIEHKQQPYVENVNAVSFCLNLSSLANNLSFLCLIPLF